MDYEKIAKALLEAEKSSVPIEPLTKRYPYLTAEDAYQIQLAQVAAKIKKGAKVVGKKIGLTSAVMQEMFQVNEPDYGHLLDNMMHVDGEVLSLDSFIEPKLESEIAFVLKQDLQGPGITAADVASATAYVVPAFELIDSRIVDWNIKFADTVADNGSSARAILGGQPTPLAEVDLAHIGMNVWKNGRQIDTAAGAAVMGNPLHAVVWLANALGRFGISLYAGEIILSGALVKAVPVQAGDTFVASFAHIGSVSVSFTKEEMS